MPKLPTVKAAEPVKSPANVALPFVWVFIQEGLWTLIAGAKVVTAFIDIAPWSTPAALHQPQPLILNLFALPIVWIPLLKKVPPSKILIVPEPNKPVPSDHSQLSTLVTPLFV